MAGLSEARIGLGSWLSITFFLFLPSIMTVIFSSNFVKLIAGQEQSERSKDRVADQEFELQAYPDQRNQPMICTS